MDYIAQRGYDVYLVDIRGYGKSTRPVQMNVARGAERNRSPGPIRRSRTSARWSISSSSGATSSKLNLLGWSWGTVTWAGTPRSTMTGSKSWCCWRPCGWAALSLRQRPAPKLGAYRTVTRDAAKARWLAGVRNPNAPQLIPAGWFDAWADATFATDPVGAAMTPPVLRAPNGVTADSQDYWNRGNPMYDPADIRVPTWLRMPSGTPICRPACSTRISTSW